MQPSEADFARAGMAFECCANCHADGDLGAHIAWIAAPKAPLDAEESLPVCCRCRLAFVRLGRRERSRVWRDACAIAQQLELGKRKP